MSDESTNEEESTAVAPFGGMKIVIRDEAALADELDKQAQDNPRKMEGGLFINFSGKMGKYSIGQDKDEEDPDEYWLIDMSASSSGYICWKGGKPVEKLMAKVGSPAIVPPEPDRNGPFNDRAGEGWYKARALVMHSIDRGLIGEFTNNSISGVSEMSKLQEESVDRLRAESPFWPVISLGKEPFGTQGNWKPMFERHGWLTTAQVNDLAQCTDLEEMSNMVAKMLGETTEEEAAPPPPVAATRRRRRL